MHHHAKFNKKNNNVVRLSNIVPFHISYQVNLYCRNNSAHNYNYFETLFHTLAFHTNFSRIFHPCSLVPHFHVSHFPPMQSGAANSCLAFSVAPVRERFCGADGSVVNSSTSSITLVGAAVWCGAQKCEFYRIV